MNIDSWQFIKDINQSYHQRKPIYWEDRGAVDGEISLLGGIKLEKQFPDPHGVLDTAFADFNHFLDVIGIGNPTAAFISLSVKKACFGGCFESYRLTVTSDACLLEAGDTEGIRRGLVAVEEEILSKGAPILPLGIIERTPAIRRRISRCFYGPIKRPPMNRDELEDDVDYYPDEYLNRLAHEGVNGLWLTISFRDTVPSAILPGFGRRTHIHIPKLRRTVVQCARFGIKVFAFFVEPTAFIDERENPRYLDISLYEKDFPGLLGNHQDNLTAFCPSSELAHSFLYEMSHTLFTLVPGLGGMIDISVGERFTHCCSGDTKNNNCSRCAPRDPADVLFDVLASLRAGMHDADPHAEFISWPYSQYISWGQEQTVLAAGRAPEGVILQHNFESGGTPEQFGKMRTVQDYWLSYAGPSNLYTQCAKSAVDSGTTMFAKLQVGCSHEVATVTHVPVPGILYEKYAAMHNLGIGGAMQGWYFGNFPSLMTRAAGRLSFRPLPESKDEFLLQFAYTSWGPYAKSVVQAWDCFQKAYELYPQYHVFGYYAPVHDGPVWPLYLKPVNLPLIPNWKFMPEYPEHGDRMGECLHDAYTYEEVLLLCSKIQRLWGEGLALLEPLEAVFANDIDRMKEINNARALGLLFESGYNILHFYHLRELLADTTSEEGLMYLAGMRAIVQREMEIGERLAGCCMLDPALGFNSEHEGYRFDPIRLRKRVSQLGVLLTEDFPEIEGRVRNGLLPFPQYSGQEPDRAVYVCKRVKPSGALFVDWKQVDRAAELDFHGREHPDRISHFKSCHDGTYLYVAIITDEAAPLALTLFPNRLWPDRTYLTDPAEDSPWMCSPISEWWPYSDKGFLDTRIASEEDRYTLAARIALDELGRSERTRLNPLRVNVKRLGDCPAGWVRKEDIAPRLSQSLTNPDEYGWFLFE